MQFFSAISWRPFDAFLSRLCGEILRLKRSAWVIRLCGYINEWENIIKNYKRCDKIRYVPARERVKTSITNRSFESSLEKLRKCTAKSAPKATTTKSNHHTSTSRCQVASRLYFSAVLLPPSFHPDSKHTAPWHHNFQTNYC